jgi:hypothetical protein
MILLCHWNLREEIKANYKKKKKGWIINGRFMKQ